MPIEVFSTDDGMLTVEKSGPFNGFDPYTTMMMKLDEPNLNGLKAENMIDTIASYQMYEFAITDQTERGKCDICGSSTDFKNRHICPVCWGKYEKEIVINLKNIVRNRMVDLA